MTDDDLTDRSSEWYRGMLVRVNTLEPFQNYERLRGGLMVTERRPLDPFTLEGLRSGPAAHVGVLDDGPDLSVEDLSVENLPVLFDGLDQTVLVAVSCLDRVLSSDEVIDPETAAHVLHAFGGGGYPAGSFRKSLIQAIMQADVDNRQRLARSFRGYVHAVAIAKDEHDGMARLLRIAHQRA